MEKVIQITQKINTLEQQVAQILAGKKLLSMKAIDRPKKKAIEAEANAVKELQIRPLAAELAKIRLADIQAFVQFVNELKNSKMWSFVGVKEYANKYGEIANHTININFNYGKMKEKETEVLNNVSLDELQLLSNENEIELDVFIQAKNELMSVEKKRSDAQKDAYTYVANGIKYHNDTGELFLKGMAHTKVVLQEGNYPPPGKSNPKTIAKKIISKKYGLKTQTEFRYIKIDFVRKFNFDKETLTIEPLQV